ncbi:MAG: hypothetical protein KC620_07080 [Myxococcales bacterium]|nr:hypothetical protein [Myxococcales bacterium]
MKDGSDEPGESGASARDERVGDEGGRRGRLEQLVPHLVRKAIRQGVDAISDEDTREAIVGEVLRRARQTSNLVVDNAEDSVRRLVGDLALPREVVDRITHRLDDYKADILDAVKEEIHEFLERLDIGLELQKVLTSLSLEVSTEIRFIPNDKSVSRSPVKPEIKTKTRVKRNRKAARGGDKEKPAED